jgi:thiamine pyrophosphokinase
MERGLMVTGGSISIDQLKSISTEIEFDRIIGVDRGIDYLFEVGLMPSHIIGDFDSCQQEALRYFDQSNVPRITFPSQKDMTDTHLALEKVLEWQLDELIILGATGSRMDHTLANLMVISRYTDVLKVIVIDTNNRIQWVRTSLILKKSHYKYISLVPMSNLVKGVTFNGVKYPLESANLDMRDSYGISNEIVDKEASLTINEGILMVIESND